MCEEEWRGEFVKFVKFVKFVGDFGDGVG